MNTRLSHFVRFSNGTNLWVFGLQRGFKKAGANSLLMSLWKVDDNATQMLMTRFYDNLTRGLSKYDALQDAQRCLREYKVVREVEQDEDKTPTQKLLHQHDVNQEEDTNKVEFVEQHPYAAPQFWAAFILLDGAN